MATILIAVERSPEAQMSAARADFDREDFLLRKFPRWSVLHWCVAAGVVSFCILALLPEARLADLSVPFSGENVRVARSLLANNSFANPFVPLKTGATAHVAPVYPFLYSLFLRALGTGYAALLALWVFNLACLSVQMALLPLLSYRLHLGVMPGLVAAALGSVSLFAPVDTHWESFFTGTLVLLYFMALWQSFSIGDTWPLAAQLGIGAAVLILTNPVTVLLVVLWHVSGILAQPPVKRARALWRAATVGGIALILVTPWIVRNYVQLGGFSFVRDNLGIELYTGNNPCAAPTLRENIQSGCHARTHPNAGEDVTIELASQGEYAFNHRKLQQAIAWIDSHRQAFLILAARRFRQFWFPNLRNRWETISVGLITLLSWIGLLIMARKNPAAARLLIVAWFFYPMIYYLVQSDPRYRYPIYWTSLLPAGLALAELATRSRFFTVARKDLDAHSKEDRALTKVSCPSRRDSIYAKATTD